MHIADQSNIWASPCGMSGLQGFDHDGLTLVCPDHDEFEGQKRCLPMHLTLVDDVEGWR